jgi:hypothetical protein
MTGRAIPRVGDPVTVRFLAAKVNGTIEWVDGDLHRLRVLTDEGEMLTFKLSPAMARFVTEAHPAGPRLLFGAGTEHNDASVLIGAAPVPPPTPPAQASRR